MKKMLRLERVIKQNDFLKKQLELENIDTFINSLGVVYVETNLPSKINLNGEKSHSSWKAKLHYHYRKEGIVHDKNSYIGYILKEHEV